MPVKLTVSQNHDGTLSHGVGINQMYFIFGTVIFINATSQANDDSYIFDFGDGTKNQTSPTNIVQHVYSSPGVYSMHVKVINSLADLTATKVIELQESIEKMNFNVTPYIQFGEDSYLMITALKYGSNICGYIDFGDSNVYVMNKANCKDFKKLPGKNYTFMFTNPNRMIKLTYRYQTKKWHNISVIIYNQVSYFSASAEIEVRYTPCPLPIVAISGGGK